MTELIYEIQTLQGVLSLYIKLKNELAIEPLPYCLDPRQLPPFISALDRDLLAPLIKIREQKELEAKKRGLKPPPFDLRQMEIPGRQVEPLLKKLAASAKLYYRSKRLLTDLFSPSEGKMSVEEAEERKLAQITLWITYGQHSVNFQECDAFIAGPPHLFIKDQFLRKLPEDLALSDLLKILNQSDLKEHEKRAWLSEIEEEGLIAVSFSSKGVKEESSQSALSFKIEPLPLLRLTDPRGCFAQLLCDYQQEGIIPYSEPRNFSFRNEKAEKSLEADLLESGYSKRPGPGSAYYCPSDKVQAALELLLEVGWRLIDNRGKELLLLSATHLDLREASDGIEVKGQLFFGTQSVEIEPLKEQLSSLKSGAYLNFPHFRGLLTRDKAVELVELLELAEQVEPQTSKLTLKKEQFAALRHLKLNDCHLNPSLRQFYAQLLAPEMQAERPPPQFQGELRPYQQQGLAWLYLLFKAKLGGILADEMGLGKTVQVLALLAFILEEQEKQKKEAASLVVAPTSLLHNWLQEALRFLPCCKAHLYWGDDKGCLKEASQENDLLITSYTTLRQNKEVFAKIEFAAIFLDEAQAIKNAQTQTAQAIYQLNSPFRLSITGTPIENHFQELLAQTRFLLPQVTFPESTEKMASAKQLIRPFILRRTKDKVAPDLPEKIEQTVWIDLSSQERSLYQTFLNQARDSAGKSHMEILAVILRLRQVCCHPMLVSSLIENPVLQASKCEQLLADIDSILLCGQKVIVFSQFTSLLHLLAQKISHPYLILEGASQNREKIVASFQQDPKKQLLLMSLKAASVGLNLTAADYVLIYEPWWNDAVEDQAIARAHRIGRKNPVIAKRYIVADSIEAKMLELKREKKKIASDLFAEEGDAFSTQELLYLLE